MAPMPRTRITSSTRSASPPMSGRCDGGVTSTAGPSFGSSVAADIGGPNEYVWYAASKGAIESIAYGLSKELAGDGIRVNAVSPGASETRVHADAGTPDKLARVAPMIPMGRVGQPEEQAEAVLFLLSDAASYISGTVLRVAGGR